MTTREIHFLNSFDAVSRLALASPEFMTEYAFQCTLEGAMKEGQWPIIGISRAALEEIAKKGVAAKTDLARGHLVSRIERLRKLRSGAVPRNEMYKYWVGCDQVVIVTKAENAKDGSDHWSEIESVPEGVNLAGKWGVRLVKKEAAVLKEMYDAL